MYRKHFIIFCKKLW